METLRSKRSILQSILLIGFGFIFFGLIGVMLIGQFIKDHESYKSYMLLPVALGAFAFSIYSLYYFLTKFPSIEIGKGGISIKTIFNEEHLSFDEIQSIGLMRKSPMSFLWVTMPMESTSIMTKEFKEIIIWDDYYRNIHRIKLRLESIKIGLKTGEFSFEHKTYNNSLPLDLRAENFIVIKGNGILNFNAIFFWGFTVFWLVYVGSNLTNVSGLLLSLFMIGFFYGLLGYQLNYFLVSDNYFQVRNHLWFWKRKTIRLTDIKEIVLEPQHRLSDSVRIRTNDYRTSLHPGGSLRDRHWIELRDRLQSRGVHVRDELLHF